MVQGSGLGFRMHVSDIGLVIAIHGLGLVISLGYP